MTRWIALAAAAALLVGCGKEAPTTSGPPPVNAPPSAPSKAAPPSGGGVSQPSNASPGPPSGGGGGGGEVVAEPSGATSMPNVGEMMTAPVAVMIEQKRKIAILNAEQMIKTFQAANDRWPKTLEEAGMGGPVPKPPDGWRWKYDAQTGALDLVKE